LLALADSAWYPILVVYTRQILDLPAAGFGLLLSVGAVGGLAGAFSAARITRRAGTTTTVTGALVTAAVAQAVLGLTGHAAAAGAALAASSFAFGGWNVATMTLRQRLAPPGLLGRVNGSYRTLLLGMEPVGALAGGAVAGALGVRAPFLLGVPVLLAAAGPCSYQALGHRSPRSGDAGRAG
jgi:predicted MFS family arabinose efflux permease